MWERIPPEAQASIRVLEARVAVLETMVQAWREPRQQHSRTSSRPPSRDPPQALGQRPRRTPSGRQPGGQPGHEGPPRALLPVEAVAVSSPVKPARCPRCQPPWPGEAPRPQRPLGPESPPIKPVVPEYRLHRVVCPACGDASRAGLPAGVPGGGVGPRGLAITARGTGAYRRSKRPPQAVRADRFGVSLGWGTVAHLEPATTPAVAVPVAEARADGQAQPVAYADETGGREGRPRAWWWTVVTPGGTVFAGRRSRRGQVAQARRGERVGGWGVTERGRGDRWYAPWRRQLCWAHRRRALAAMLARGGRSRASGEAWRGQAHQMFHDWHRVRDGTPAHARFAPDLRPIRREVERLLAAGHTCGVPKTAGTGRDLLKRRQALWTVVRQGGVAPTTHAAERAIRPGVLWRKGRVGTQSPEGSPFVEAMLTVVATLTPPHRQVRDDLTAACEAARRGAAAPALRPTPAALAQRLRPAA